jgi:integrase
MPRVDRIELPNGCSCTPPIIQPKDWKRNVKKDWAITCRFYEPGRPAPYQYAVKGMNHKKSFLERKLLTGDIAAEVLRQLKKGYNPRLQVVMEPRDVEISPVHPFTTGLTYALSKLRGVPGYLIDVKSCVKGITENAGDIAEKVISEVTTRDLEGILERCSKSNPRFTAYRHNRYRSYLISLFKVLKKAQAVETNPALEVERLKAVKKKRKTTTKEERQLISDHLKKYHYSFWRFIQIFFHSGSRETELMRLRLEDIDLRRQVFTTVVKKGKEYREEEGIIKNSILPLWEELISECQPGQYLFSKSLLPGTQPIRPDQVGRRWAKYVKGKPNERYPHWGGLGIDKDLYSLKHSNTSAITGILSDEDAARLNKHTSTAMVVKIYDVERGDRQAERLKNVSNEF